MSAPKMHPDEVDIDAALVGRLISEQFPQYADLPVARLRSSGTVNAIYRLGEQLYARLPRVESYAGDLGKEWRWLPTLAPHLTLQVPEPVAQGQPTVGYPFPWAIYRWIDGQPYDLVDDAQAAKDLAQFVLELRSIEPEAGAPHGGRQPLLELDAYTREVIDACGNVIDREAAMEVWERALEAPVWSGTPVWVHADLLRPNLLVHHGLLCAVIDFGSCGVGDPSADVIAAWSVFGPVGRETYRHALEVDDGTWNRARGVALHQAAMIIPYYRESNPDFVAQAKRTVEQVIADYAYGQ
jgi:aminoglycoside phosphotransferase (APT) family kinase protein